jgi:CubicO group peptidase (beta-lactamase class C family)
MPASVASQRVRQLLTGLTVLMSLSQGVSGSSLSTLKQEIVSLKEANKIGAVAYGVVSRENIVLQEAIGYYNKEELRPVSLDSIFRIGSISKTFTALGALALENMSEFHLSKPVNNYLSQLPYENLWSKEFPISVAHLVEHTAGFRDMTRKEFDQLAPLTLADAFLVDPQSRVTVWPPGHHSSYSNSGAGVTTAVLEAVSGLKFEDFMWRNVFQPLQLRSASFTPPNEKYPALVQGYDADGETAIPYWHQLYPAFGALNISPRDMLRFVMFLLNEGAIDGEQIFPSGLIKQMVRPTTTLAARAGLQYGYGKGIYQFQHKGISFYGHGGDADGYLAYFAYSPHLKLGYFVVINAYQQDTLQTIKECIQDFMVGEERGVFPKPSTLQPEAESILFGEYEEVTTRFVSNKTAKRLEIYRGIDGSIYTRLNDANVQELLPISAHLFRRRWHSVATAALIGVNDEVYFQGDFGNFRKVR